MATRKTKQTALVPAPAVPVAHGPVIDITALQQRIDSYRAEGVNLVLPSIKIEALTPYHMPSLEEVRLDPDPQKGDVYQSRGGRLALSKVGLLKLSYAAGIVWNWAECRRIDDRLNPSRVEFQAVGSVRRSDGSWSILPATYELDLDVVADQLRDEIEKEIEKDSKEAEATAKKLGVSIAEVIERWVKQDLLAKRRFKNALAETGAMLRAIRSLLSLRSTYTRDELRKPFVVFRVIFRPDLSDPDFKRLLIAQSMASMTAIYGPDAVKPEMLKAMTCPINGAAAEDDDLQPSPDELMDVLGRAGVSGQHDVPFLDEELGMGPAHAQPDESPAQVQAAAADQAKPRAPEAAHTSAPPKATEAPKVAAPASSTKSEPVQAAAPAAKPEPAAPPEDLPFGNLPSAGQAKPKIEIDEATGLPTKPLAELTPEEFESLPRGTKEDVVEAMMALKKGWKVNNPDLPSWQEKYLGRFFFERLLPCADKEI